MPNTATYEATTKQICLRACLPAVATWLLVPLTFLLPFVNSTRSPYFDLTGTFAQFAYWLSRSGGRVGAPIVAAAMLALLITGGGVRLTRKWKEVITVVLVAVVCGGGGVAKTVYFIKPQFEMPRPNIIWLAGGNGTGPLGMTPEEFYESGPKQARGELLARVLRSAPRPVALSSSIEAHWIAETGYSFPSGHAFSAMFIATFFLMTGATYLATKRLWMFYALSPWAAAVCYSRSILRVHTPVDITVGGFLGLVVGILAWVIARTLIGRLRHAERLRATRRS
jgi:phosphatidylglycerophosphatase B